MIFPIRSDITAVIQHPIVAVQIGVLVGALVAGTASLALSYRFARVAQGATKIGLTAWLAVLGYRLFENPPALWGACHSGATCSASVSLVSMVTALGYLAAQRHRPNDSPTGPQLFLLASAFTLTGFELLCASTNPLHVILFHALPTVFSLVILLTLVQWGVKRVPRNP